jgi:hypothetical protein
MNLASTFTAKVMSGLEQICRNTSLPTTSGNSLPAWVQWFAFRHKYGSWCQGGGHLPGCSHPNQFENVSNQLGLGDLDGSLASVPLDVQREEAGGLPNVPAGKLLLSGHLQAQPVPQWYLQP